MIVQGKILASDRILIENIEAQINDYIKSYESGKKDWTL